MVLSLHKREAVLALQITTSPEPEPQRAEPAIGPGASGPRMRRALIVEDEPILRQHLARILERSGFDVDQASEGLSALRLLSDEDYEVVITDLVLPLGNGLEVVEQACTGEEPPSVVLITGYLSPDVGRKALLAGATDFLEKPFTRERLLSALPQA